MRRIDDLADVSAAVEAARAEAIAAFGDGTLYAERVVAPARHVEVQLLGDRHGNLVCRGERDCSVQRRHQKLVEESPSPAIHSQQRAALFDSARRIAGAVDFHSAATAEFLVDQDGNHFFLELNARLQVEHGVTELVTGLDLVALQILVAAGERLPPEVVASEPRGHAIEVRLYAEDPYDAFRPTAGRVTAWRMPAGPGIRVDAGVEADTELSPEYDPLLAKIMVHAADRQTALARLRRALDETIVGGLQTDLAFHAWLVRDQAFARGVYDTSLVSERWGDGPPPADGELAMAAVAASHARATLASSTKRRGERAASAPDDGAAPSPWVRAARIESLRHK
jgi:acetyl/propionyl-CoA carboxylase alpha subunit